MFFQRRQEKGLSSIEVLDMSGMVAAIKRSQAVIEFHPDGKIITANDNFLNAMGYGLDEIVGRHHSMFVEADLRDSREYQEFWAGLRQGRFASEKFKRIAKNGRVVWIQASYNPIMDANGVTYKVVKFATDITAVEDERASREVQAGEAARTQAHVVTSLAKGLRQLATGDLIHRIEDSFSTEFEQLRTDFNDAIGKLQGAMGSIANNASAINAASEELSTAANDLSRRTEQQAATLEETAAALDQVTATVKKSAEGAGHARQVVASSKAEAERSGDVVRQAVKAMTSIESSSRQISQIIGVIDEIAFQTNLLALNAGVEAARAGDAGRGFAVVASEVRGLAQRSAEAAKEIKGLISASSDHVTQGVSLVGEAGKAIEKIIKDFGDINGVVVDIACSAQEQSTALGEINTAVNQMDQVTQQNAAMVEESTAASHALSQEAGDLAQALGNFKIQDADVRTLTPRRTRTAAPKSAPMLKTVARQGMSAAVRKAPAPVEDSWEEF